MEGEEFLSHMNPKNFKEKAVALARAESDIEYPRVTFLDIDNLL